MYNVRTMEPRIQYAKTEDGVNIAYYVMGEGPPLVIVHSPIWGHLRLQVIPEHHRSGRGIGRDCSIVRFDYRGTGLSDRTVTDFSVEAGARDLEAVVHQLELERFSMIGCIHGGPVAIAFASAHQAHVERLLLFNSFTRPRLQLDRPGGRFRDALRDLAPDDWQQYTLTIAAGNLDYSDGGQIRPGQIRKVAELYRESMTPDTVLAWAEAARRTDVTDLLEHVRAETLVLCSQREDIPLEWSRELASGIPGARLATTPRSPSLWGDEETRLADDFLLGRDEPRAGSRVSADVHTILFTDVEESTALTQRLGDARAREVLRTHEGIVRDALRSHGGSEVKTMGDGFMASFSSATKALECAISMQRSFEEHNETAEEPIRVRVGLNAGEPIAEEEDLFGTAVIRAARIAALAAGGEILVANVVRELSEGKGFLFSDRGDTALRGFEDPVRLFEVRWRAEGSP